MKLIQQLRQRSKPNETAGNAAEVHRVLHEMSLEESIRYKADDQVEKWLYKLLCLDAANANYKLNGTPPPECCQL